jgi:hypothetical protein
MASAERFLARPEIVSFVMIAAFYLLLQDKKYRSLWGSLALGLLQVVWINCHGLFVVGPFLVACYWTVAVAARLRGRTSDFVPLTRTLLAVLVATLITPFGFEGWHYAGLLLFEVSSQDTGVFTSLGELSSVFGAGTRAAPAFWFFVTLLFLAALAAASVVFRGRVSSRLLIVVGLGAAAFSGRRNMALFALVAAPFVAEYARDFVSRDWRAPRNMALASAIVILAWAAFPLSGGYYVMMEFPARFGLGVTPSFFPHGLTSFLERTHFEGQVLNSNTLGGYYLYHNYPHRIPLTDGRWEVVDQAVLEKILYESRDAVAWRDLVRRFEIRGILLAHTSPEAAALLPALRVAPEWRLVYYDQAASFWMPADAPHGPPAVALDDPRTLPVLARVDDGLILNAFLAGVGAGELQLRILDQTLAFGHHRAVLLEQRGMLEVAMGRLREAQRTFAALLEEVPGHLLALNELAFLAYGRGDLQEAASLLEKALALDPDNRELRGNYERIQRAMVR